MRKRLLAIVATAALVVAMVPSMVFAAGGVASIGGTEYATLQAAFNAVGNGETIQINEGTISEGTIEMPETLKNVTIKGAEGHKSILKDMTIMASDGNSIDYQGITIDGIVFDNSRISVTGWRTGDVTLKDWTITNNIFKDINDSSNSAAIHFNTADKEAVQNITIKGNVIDGALGGSKSGIYLQSTGATIIEDNIINNVAFRPYVIQLTTDDGIDDTFKVEGNTFSGSSVGRAQALANNSSGTDKVDLTVKKNIFKGITNAQQICYWNFNPDKTNNDFSKNYFDIDIENNPNKIYFNAAAGSVDDLIEYGVTPVYKELNEDGTIDEESLTCTGGQHEFTKKDAVAPTYEAEGIKEHFECSSCGELRLAVDGESVEQSEITIAKLVKPEASPNTGDNNMAPFAVAGLVLAAMAAVVATRRREN